MENAINNSRDPDCIVNRYAMTDSHIFCVTENRKEMKFYESNPYQAKFGDADVSSDAEEKPRMAIFFNSFFKRSRAFSFRKRPCSLIVFRETSKQKPRLSFLDRLRSLKKLKSTEFFKFRFSRNSRHRTSNIWSREKGETPNGVLTCKQALDKRTFRHTFAGDLQDFDTAGDANLISSALETISIEDTESQEVNKRWKNVQMCLKGSTRKTFDPSVTSCYNSITVFPEDASNKYTKIPQECKKSRKTNFLNYLKKMSLKKKLNTGTAGEKTDHNDKNPDSLFDSASVKQECDQNYSDKSTRTKDRKNLSKVIDFSKVVQLISRASKQRNFSDVYSQFEEIPEAKSSCHEHDLQTSPIIPETGKGKCILLSQSSLSSDSGMCNPLCKPSSPESRFSHEVTIAEISVRWCNSELLDTFTPVSFPHDGPKISDGGDNCQAPNVGVHCNETSELPDVTTAQKNEIHPNDICEVALGNETPGQRHHAVLPLTSVGDSDQVSAKENVDGLPHDEGNGRFEDMCNNQTKEICRKLPHPVSDCGQLCNWQCVIPKDYSPAIAELNVRSRMPADSPGIGICGHSSPASRIKLRNRRARQRPFSVIDGTTLIEHCEKTSNLHQPASCRPPPPHHVPPFRAVSHRDRPLLLSQSTPIGLDQVGWKSHILAVTDPESGQSRAVWSEVPHQFPALATLHSMGKDVGGEPGPCLSELQLSLLSLPQVRGTVFRETACGDVPVDNITPADGVRRGQVASAYQQKVVRHTRGQSHIRVVPGESNVIL